jgi:hypothetical protein
MHDRKVANCMTRSVFNLMLECEEFVRSLDASQLGLLSCFAIPNFLRRRIFASHLSSNHFPLRYIEQLSTQRFDATLDHRQFLP